MEINHLQDHDLSQLYEFYKIIHPDNTLQEIKAYVDHWLDKTPNSMDYVSIQKNGGEIIGLNFNSPMSFWFAGQKHESGWGFDLYVKEQYREANYGVDLLLYNKRKYPTNYATGSNPTAAKILFAMGAKQIGEIRKYVGIANPLNVFFSICRGYVSINRFPQNVEIGGKVFKKINGDELPEIVTPYNSNVLEINHDAEFLRWKFFNSHREYAFYLERETNNYIVLRTILKNHITLLMVTDFRCNINSCAELETLHKVVKTVANQIGVAFIFCGSSHASIDKVFEKHYYRMIGRHRPIITFDKNCTGTKYKDTIANRKFVLITLSDSDGEPI